jgi:hypothetical protein
MGDARGEIIVHAKYEPRCSGDGLRLLSRGDDDRNRGTGDALRERSRGMFFLF